MQWESSAVVTAKDNIVSCMLDNDRVLLDLSSSRYYSLNKVGAHVWEQMTEPLSVEELRARFLARFDVDVDRGIRDLDALLTKLSQSALIDIRHDQAA